MTERYDTPLSERFAKDAADEQFLARLNTILEPFEREEYRDLPETYPTLYVIGAPRSGTTLLSQVFCSHLDVSYVSNLSAAFWKAPLVGRSRQRRQRAFSRAPTFVVRSEFGRTTGLYEPHEFGYFWSRQLGYPDMQQRDASFEEQIDWASVRKTLNNMTHAVGKPRCLSPFCSRFTSLG
ncbi:MAG: sulfotransferase [Trueperaceae bacterium]|nr:sulfotransferase [Trueperaceae bacterium]